MGLREELEQQGDWLFRWRSYVPLIVFPVAGLALYCVRIDSPGIWHIIYSSICITISVLGLVIRCYTIGHVPGGTSGRNTKTQIANSLNTTGIYSIVRHPLYLGNYLIMFGIVLYIPIAWFAILFSFFYAAYYERIMFREEEFLRSKYGEVFVTWSKRTPAFFPRFKNFVTPSLSFSFVNVLRREYSAFYAMVTMFVILEHLVIWRFTLVFSFKTGWLITWGCGTVIYLTLRNLKKKTKVLSVEGR
jgi:protein-S-isoprenylcysteine O-methyltransferase Ste14